MDFVPLKLMQVRVEQNGSDSDTAMLAELLYLGEFVLKISVLAFISMIEDDPENHRYRLLHGIVRADGLGDWVEALDEAVSGPASQHISPSFFELRKELTFGYGADSWVYGAVSNLTEAILCLTDDERKISNKVALRTWFQLFSEFRNKTRGHGAVTPAKCAEILPLLKASLTKLCINNPVFKLSWAYLHRNLSGKYRVIPLGGDPKPFEVLKSASTVSGEHFDDGVYVSKERFTRVELIHSNVDVSDFLFPNGAFRKETYELHSLITDNRAKGDGALYLNPVGSLPPSQTEGLGELQIVGEVFTNMPQMPSDYISRPDLEAEVHEALTNDRHPIVTLVGRGGIGKTSTALSVLNKIAENDRYDVIVWFSARDIDLMTSGAKLVQPHLLTDKNIARVYRSLVDGPTEGPDGEITAVELMAKHLYNSPNGPTLFVFDNFETLQSPLDLFQWLDQNIRLPNKAVITSRFRDFKADFPISVTGMNNSESDALINQMSKLLGIEELIGSEEKNTIVEESDGHPYVIKIMLGEISDAGKFSKPSRIIARKDDILDALFERTYASLPPISVQIFLTLSGWRSLVPQLAVEAMVFRRGDENVDPEMGIDKLVKMSLVERRPAADGADFLSVPLAAGLFGKGKLQVSPQKALIENDRRFLQDIGATSSTGLSDGLQTRMAPYFRKIARQIAEGQLEFDQIQPVLIYLAQGFPPAWLMLAELVEEISNGQKLEDTAQWVQRFLETRPPREQAEQAWRRLLAIYRRQGDVIGACNALMKLSETLVPPLNEISNMANELNKASDLKKDLGVEERAAIYKPLATLMENQIDDASATDFSRLSWLYLHCGEEQRALEAAEMGLDVESHKVVHIQA